MSEWIVEALDRKPLRIDDQTVAEDLAEDLAERLEALLASRMLEATADGWRDLALALAMEHLPAFAIETPVDRSSLGGAPATMGNFITRSMAKAEIQAQEATGPKWGARKRAVAVVANKLGIAPGTVNNALSRRAPPSDDMRLAPYRRKAAMAMLLAARQISSQ